MTLPGDDLWDWLSRENPVFANIAALFAAAARGPAPARGQPGPDLFPGRGVRFRQPPPPDHLELLLVEQTFGTEELASYSRHIQPVEEPPRLLDAS